MVLEEIPAEVGRVGLVGSVGGLAAFLLYSRCLRRFPSSHDIPSSYFKGKKFLRGVVTHVGDGDNFQFLHMPLMRHMLRMGRKVGKKEAEGQTFGVRLAGIDAPECAHFGNPDQPFGPEAKKWLKDTLQDKTVMVQLFHRDQYNRAVCMVWRKGFWTWENVSYMILDEGLATVYTSMGAVYGEEGKEAFDVREQEARRRKVGMWSQKKSSFVSPKDYKRALRSND